jgi:hypothetical protein
VIAYIVSLSRTVIAWVGVVSAIMSSAALLAQTSPITVRVGTGVGTPIAPGGTGTIPIVVEFSPSASVPRLGALTVRVTWDAQRLSMAELLPGETGTVVAGAATAGEQRVSFFDPRGVNSTFTLARLRMRGQSIGGNTPISIAVFSAATETGQSLLGSITTASAHAVCIGSITGGLVGDVNADNLVDILDAQLIARFAVGLSVTNSDAIGRGGDVTNDGVVDIVDAQQVARFVIGLPSAPRIGQPGAGAFCGAINQPRRILRISGDSQVVAPGTPATPRGMFTRVVDAVGSPVPGALVRYQIPLPNNQSETITMVTNASGESGIVAGTSSLAAGVYTIIARSEGATEAAFALFVGTPPSTNRIAIATSPSSQYGAGDTVRASVRVTTTANVPVPDADVTWVLQGYSPATFKTNASGVSGVVWIAPTTPGTYTGTAYLGSSSSSGSRVDFSYEVRAAGADSRIITVVSPNPVTVSVGAKVSMTAKVTNAGGEPQSGVTVTWEEQGYEPFSQLTRTDGTATAEWTATNVGTFSGTVTIGNAGANGPRTTFRYIVSAPTASRFGLESRVVGNIPSGVRTAIDQAVARVRTVVVEETGRASLDGIDLSACRNWIPAGQTGTVNSHLVFVRVAPIDGSGGTLARAGPCLSWTSNGTAAISAVEVDVDDSNVPVADMFSTVLHELLHGLGFGGSDTWESYLRGLSTTNPVFVGPTALAEWAALDGLRLIAQGAPIESDGGVGTAGGHWRESTLRTELMTGYANPGVLNPFSRLTIGALRDLGYTVNLAVADRFVIPTGAFLTTPGIPPRSLLNDVVRVRGGTLRDERPAAIRTPSANQWKGRR